MNISPKIALAAVALCANFALGPVAAASAAPSSQSTAVSVSVSSLPHALPAVIRGGDTWNKTVAFAGCVTAVGVPLGVAWAFAMNPAVITWVMGGQMLPPTVGAGFSKYLWYVKGTCRYAILGR